jgi:hypothetical protein
MSFSIKSLVTQYLQLLTVSYSVLQCLTTSYGTRTLVIGTDHCLQQGTASYNNGPLVTMTCRYLPLVTITDPDFLYKYDSCVKT